MGKTADNILAEYEASDDRTFKRLYAQHIRAWISKLNKEGLTNTSIKVMVGAVKSFFRYNDLPLGLVPQAMDSVVYHNKDIAREEISQILAVSKPRERAFFAVMAQSGLRPYTMAKLRMKNLEDLDKIPCMITVPREIAKGKYGSYVTFMGADGAKHLKQYLVTRTALGPESYVFCAHDDPNKPVNTKDMSRAFKIAAHRLEQTGAMKFEVRKGKPSEIRFYTLRKFFRKQAALMGFENVQYLMGHTVKGSDNNYKPQDPEFYRKIYEEKAMPNLRLESKHPAETEHLIVEQAKQIEDLRRENEELKAKMSQLAVQTGSLETLLKRVQDLERKLSDPNFS